MCSHVWVTQNQQALVFVLLCMVIMVSVLLKVLCVHVFSCSGGSTSTGSCLCSSPHGHHAECFVEVVFVHVFVCLGDSKCECADCDGWSLR